MDEDENMKDGGSLDQQETNQTKSSNTSALEKAKNAKKKKDNAENLVKTIKNIKNIKIYLIVGAVVIALIFIMIILAGAYYFLDLDSKDRTVTVVNNAVGNQALGKIIEMDSNKYKISYNGKEGTDAIKELLKENDMNFNDYTKEEMNILYKALKAEWATTYPNLGDDVDNTDMKSDYVQGVITIRRKGEGYDNELKYKPYDEFKLLGDASALNYFSLNEGNLIVANIGSNNIGYSTSGSVPDADIYQDTGVMYDVTETAIDYRSMIGVHAMPFEMSLSLMTNTEDLHFMDDLLDKVFESTIELTIFDNTTTTVTVETAKTNVETTYEKTIQYEETNARTDFMGPVIPQSKEEKVTSTQKDTTDYTITTTNTSVSNSYTVALTNVSSWIADVTNEYTFTTETNETTLEPTKTDTSEKGSPVAITDTSTDSELKKYADDNFKEKRKPVTDASGNPIKDADGNTVVDVTTYTPKGGTITATTNTTTQIEGKTTVIEKKFVKSDDSPKTANEGVKFKEVYDRNEYAQGNFNNVDTWLFEMLANTESGIDYISIIKFLLWKCTGIDYGVTDIKDILNYYNEQTFTYVSGYSSGGGYVDGNGNSKLWLPISSKTITDAEGKTVGQNSTVEINKGDVYFGTGNDIIPVTITGRYPAYSSGKAHGGTDFAPSQGGNYYIIAAADGVVTHVVSNLNVNSYKTSNPTAKQYNYGFGNEVTINHDSLGLYTLYAHMEFNEVYVTNGQRVKQGQIIGRMGNTGNSSNKHLHFEVRTGPSSKERTQPEDYVSISNPRPMEVVFTGGGTRTRTEKLAGVGGSIPLLSRESAQVLKMRDKMEGVAGYENGTYRVYNNGVDKMLELARGVVIGTKSGGTYDWARKILGRNVGIGDKVTEEEYVQLYRYVVSYIVKMVDKAEANNNIKLKQNQYDAVFLLAYFQPSSASSSVKAYKDRGIKGYWDSIKNKITSNGRVADGLKWRRAEEMELFEIGDYDPGESASGQRKYNQYLQKYK